MATQFRPSRRQPGRRREYQMQAHQAAEAMMASMKLNGIDRLWFVSGTELAFFQESAIKHRALGQAHAPAHDDDPRERGPGRRLRRDHGDPPAVGHRLPRGVRPDQRRGRDPQRGPRPLSGADHVGVSAVGRSAERAGRRATPTSSGTSRSATRASCCASTCAGITSWPPTTTPGSWSAAPSRS